MAVTRDGRLFVGLEDGMLSTADGCQEDREPGIEGETIKDLTVDGTGNVVYAITGALGKPGRVWKRVNGRWKKIGKDYENTNFLTIEVAASNPRRIYLTGESWTTVRGEVWRSDDGGETFVEQKNELKASGPFFISYVDPKDAGRIVLRHLHMQGSDVLVSTDGGKTLREVVHWTSAMFGFAKTEDGKTIWIGSGDPKDGLWRSDDRGEHYEHVNNEGVYCLFALGGSLYSCSNPYALGGYALGISHDGGKTIEKASGFADVGGAMLCDAGASLCGPSWPEVRASILPPEDAGSAEELVDAAKPATFPTRRPRSDAGADALRSNSRSCGCTAVGAALTAPPWVIFFLAGFFPLGVWARARNRVDRNRSDAGPYESI
jgi:hypothetical protein